MMTVERARTHAVRKPWGSSDLKPWSKIDADGHTIGELWFQRDDINAPDSALLLKLTKEPLSIQGHPDDAFTRSIGLKNGKSDRLLETAR